MKFYTYILFFVLSFQVFSQNSTADFSFGNTFYFNLNKGETITFNEVEIELLETMNHYNHLKIGTDSLWLKVSRRTLPVYAGGIRLFVADNRNVQQLTNDSSTHSLLKKQVLIAVSDAGKRLLNEFDYQFPVSFNDGFLWKAEEDSHLFSYMGSTVLNENCRNSSHAGIDIDLHDARGKEKHLLVAIENSTVIWVEDKNIDAENKQACVLLESKSQPGIFYVYQHLYNKKVFVKKGDELLRGEPIGNIWGDEIWGHLHFAIVQSDSIPTYENRFVNLVNFFPQLYELYFQGSYNLNRTFSKGRISFGQRSDVNGNEKNNLAYEPYSGKGWILGNWNTADKLESVANELEANVRLKKTLFEDENAKCANPNSWFDYELNVRNGTYRIRAKVGDIKQMSWQKITFEGVPAATYSLKEGELKWTNERVVKVNDGKLSIRVFVDENNEKIAGLSEIVFQQVY